jgi:hypothetical protein
MLRGTYVSQELNVVTEQAYPSWLTLPFIAVKPSLVASFAQYLQNTQIWMSLA